MQFSCSVSLLGVPAKPLQAIACVGNDSQPIKLYSGGRKWNNYINPKKRMSWRLGQLLRLTKS